MKTRDIVLLLGGGYLLMKATGSGSGILHVSGQPANLSNSLIPNVLRTVTSLIPGMSAAGYTAAQIAAAGLTTAPGPNGTTVLADPYVSVVGGNYNETDLNSSGQAVDYYGTDVATSQQEQLAAEGIDTGS